MHFRLIRIDNVVALLNHVSDTAYVVGLMNSATFTAWIELESMHRRYVDDRRGWRRPRRLDKAYQVRRKPCESE